MKNICMTAYTNYSIDARVRRAAGTLAGAGHHVDVISLQEKNSVFYEKINGVNVYCVNQKKYQGESNLAYIFSYFTFFLRVFMKMTRMFFKKRYAVIHCHNMPDFIVFTALIPKLCGARIILDIHDSMPELYKTKNFNPFLQKIILGMLSFQEKVSAGFADLVITVHEPIRKRIQERLKLRPEKFQVIMNLADPTVFFPMQPPRGQEGDVFKLIYHGTLSSRYGLEVIIRGLQKVLKKNYNVQLDIYGEGDGFFSLGAMAGKLGLNEAVRVHKAVPLDELPEKINHADLGIVSYIPSDATDLMLPCKLMEFIAMEKPVLTVKNSAIAHYFSNGELPYYKANDSSSFAEQLINMITRPDVLTEAQKKVADFNKKMNWLSEKRKYIGLVNSLVK